MRAQGITHVVSNKKKFNDITLKIANNSKNIFIILSVRANVHFNDAMRSYL